MAVTVAIVAGASNDVASLASALLGDRVSWATLEGLRLELAASL
jgi:hypothetical protein